MKTWFVSVKPSSQYVDVCARTVSVGCGVIGLIFGISVVWTLIRLFEVWFFVLEIGGFWDDWVDLYAGFHVSVFVEYGRCVSFCLVFIHGFFF